MAKMEKKISRARQMHLVPECKNCGERLMRWGWYEDPFEPVEYWYCLECDRAGREPCIQVHARRKETLGV